MSTRDKSATASRRKPTITMTLSKANIEFAKRESKKRRWSVSLWIDAMIEGYRASNVSTEWNNGTLP